MRMESVEKRTKNKKHNLEWTKYNCHTFGTLKCYDEEYKRKVLMKI